MVLFIFLLIVYYIVYEAIVYLWIPDRGHLKDLIQIIIWHLRIG